MQYIVNIYTTYSENMVVKKKSIENERKRVIEKGGSMANEKKKMQWKNICLRMPKDMVSTIDKIVESQVGITRTGWVLQALQEKLNKDYL